MLNIFKRIKYLKIITAWLVIAITVGVFYSYISANPAIWWQLQKTSPWTIIGILIGYGAMLALLVWLYKTMTEICKVTMPLSEHALVTMYSTVVNFFGPLQSGPGFRLVYLKKKHKINVPAYIGVTIWYYACFGFLSGLILLAGWLGWWILIVALTVLIIAILQFQTLSGLTKKIPFLRHKMPQLVSWRSLAVMALLSAVQIVIVTGIYFIELRSLSPSLSLQQTLIYTAAANLALFVSLTPGAVGFRETFLYFSRSIHGINEQTIVTANILDRGVYVLFLGLLFLGILMLHGKQKITQYAS